METDTLLTHPWPDGFVVPAGRNYCFETNLSSGLNVMVESGGEFLWVPWRSGLSSNPLSAIVYGVAKFIRRKYRLMRKGQTITFWVGGALVLILSFSTTLWLTEPEVPPADKIKLLAASAISDEATLNAAARAAGLQNSPYVQGHVDGLNRLDATNVSIAGWATETITFISKGAPVIVMAFSEGRNILTIETKGERPDVNVALKLSDLARKNVAFTGSLKCSSGQKLVIVGATLSGTYAVLGSLNCP